MIFNATNILTQSLWRDEAFSALLSIKNLGEIIPITAKDFSPPLYYFFLHFWIKIFGLGEVALRSFSLFFLILTAVAGYFLAKKLFSRKLGWLTLLFIILNPLLFYYAFEARFYTLFCFLSTISFYFLLTERWPLFVSFSLLGLYSHNYMAFSLVGMLLAYIFLNGLDKKKGLFLSLGAIAVGFLPWLRVLLTQTKSVVGSYWITRPEIMDIFKALAQFVAGPLGDYSQVLALVTLVFTLVFIRVGLSNRKSYSLLVWIFVPFFLSILTSYFIPIFVARYLIFVTIPLTIILVYIFPLKPRLQLPLVICLLGLFLPRDLQLWQNPNKFPIREKVVGLSQTWAGEPIVCESTLNFFEVKYYLLRSNPRAVEKLCLLSSGRLMFAGGALVEENEMVERPPRENYFWIDTVGNISYKFGSLATKPTTE